MPKPDESAGLSPPISVLIVDDDPDTREMYEQALAIEGFSVRTAENGTEAMNHATEYDPDVIVTDLKMGAVSGLDLIRRIKSEARTQRIRVIVLSGSSLARGEILSLQAGCDAYLTKPCLPTDLARVIREAAADARRSSDL